MEINAIKKLIPHREPFLFVDRVVNQTKTSIETEKYIPEDLPVFDGHYPDNPVMPGVLLCEAVFQSGALLMANQMKDLNSDKVPVLTRIENAKFKRMVSPGDNINIKVQLLETISGVSFFKGKLYLDNKVSLIVEFACALAPKPS